MRFEYAQLVRAPRDKVFRAWTDYEAYPEWDPVVFTKVKAVERVGNTARLDAQVKFMGMRMPRRETHLLTPPERVEVDGSVRDASNRTMWTFEAVNEGTMLTALIEVQFKGMLKLLQPIAERQLRTVLPQWMRAFAGYVESQETLAG